MSQGRRSVMIKVAALSLFQSTYLLRVGIKYRVLSVLSTGEQPSRAAVPNLFDSRSPF